MPTASVETMAATTMHRIEVRSRSDARARALERDAKALGFPLTSAVTASIYLIEATLSTDQVVLICDRLLADPVIESAHVGATPIPQGGRVIEVHPLPGIMDPVAASVRSAIADLLGFDAGRPLAVSTGTRYELHGLDGPQAARLARRLLANPVIHAILEGAYVPERLPRGTAAAFHVRQVPILGLTDDQLERLSRDAHLFLSLDEMRAIQAEYQRLGREPKEIELETLAQTWSEHCVHKTLKSTVRYEAPPGVQDPIVWDGRPGHTREADGSITINNLLKSTVAAATHELIAEGVDWTLSVFKDNAGVIALDDDHAVCVKVETHNHPSAIEPYGGAATGIGGCIRDVMGTGLGAKPIASTDVFCVAHPSAWAEPDATPTADRPALPPGCLHPRRTLAEVVAGVRDYGNRMGIPTVSGAVDFDNRHIGNPLVFCGCIGILPRDKVHGGAKAGDLIVALGGRTGRDGVHGATFSSAELEHTAADEFAHAVQIGNAIEEKRVLDAILRARDHESGTLFRAITDCGAGGFSSAVGEMAGRLGAVVRLERAPLKYDGLTHTEIWISEAQERMVVAVPPKKLAALEEICRREGVESAVLGEFGTPDGDLILTYNGVEVGRLCTRFLHEGIPTPTRRARWSPPPPVHRPPTAIPGTMEEALRRVLGHPSVASKHWIVRQYDHEVQGNVVIKPMAGAVGAGPSDASVIEPAPGTGRGLAIGAGLATRFGDPDAGGDAYQMALSAIDECVRNLACAGADPSRIAILDNFCWPSCAKPENLGTLVRAAEGCYDGAKAYRTPFVSGKDSLNNQLRYVDPATGEQRTIEIPPTLLITGIGIVPDLGRCLTVDAKSPGNVIALLSPPAPATLGASVHESIWGGRGPIATVDLALGPAAARAMSALAACGLARSAHDCSDGGLLVALCEMLFATIGAPDRAGGPMGCEVRSPDALADDAARAWALGEGPSRYLVELAPGDLARARETAREAHPSLRVEVVATLTADAKVRWPSRGLDVEVESLWRSWRAPLDW